MDPICKIIWILRPSNSILVVARQALPNKLRLVVLKLLKSNQIQVKLWVCEILSALQHLHDRDPVIMHRDLKPANIVLSRDQKHLKLIDFGLAKCFERIERDDDAHTHLVRVHTMNIGSPCYMAPEVVTSCIAGAAEYTEKADIYSAALIIWYLLTGQKPRRRAKPTDRPDVKPARRRWAELSDVVERMWAGEAEARPSAGECLEAVDVLEVQAPSCSW